MRITIFVGRLATGISLACFCSLPVQAGELPHSIPDKDTKYSPFVGVDYPNQVFFGDTHCHTSFSTDAGMLGNKLGPDDAYLFAKGEAVISSNGVRARVHLTDLVQPVIGVDPDQGPGREKLSDPGP